MRMSIFLTFIHVILQTSQIGIHTEHQKNLVGSWIVASFWNSKDLILVSRGGKWLDGGKFPPSLGSYATICKANSGGPLDWTKYKYLDAIHMDIAFGDCLFSSWSWLGNPFGIPWNSAIIPIPDLLNSRIFIRILFF